MSETRGNIFLTTGQTQEDLVRELEADPRFLWARPVPSFQGKWLSIVEAMIDPNLHLTEVEIEAVCIEIGMFHAGSMKAMIAKCERLQAMG